MFRRRCEDQPSPQQRDSPSWDQDLSGARNVQLKERKPFYRLGLFAVPYRLVGVEVKGKRFFV